jgi:hypothetical protein
VCLSRPLSALDEGDDGKGLLKQKWMDGELGECTVARRTSYRIKDSGLCGALIVKIMNSKKKGAAWEYCRSRRGAGMDTAA